MQLDRMKQYHEPVTQYSRIHPPLWRKAPRRLWQQDGRERLSCVAVHSAYGWARVPADALHGDPAHARVVGVVDVGVGAG